MNCVAFAQIAPCSWRVNYGGDWWMFTRVIESGRKGAMACHCSNSVGVVSVTGPAGARQPRDVPRGSVCVTPPISATSAGHEQLRSAARGTESDGRYDGHRLRLERQRPECRPVSVAPLHNGPTPHERRMVFRRFIHADAANRPCCLPAQPSRTVRYPPRSRSIRVSTCTSVQAQHARAPRDHAA
jgi:hypothetical protein